MLNRLMAWLAPGRATAGQRPEECVTESLDFSVADFSRLRVGGVFSVTVNLAATYKVQVFADGNVLKGVRAELQGDKLVLAYDGNITSAQVLRAEITCPGLLEVDAREASSVVVADIAKATFKVRAQDNSRVVLAGAVEDLTLAASGASRVKAKRLRAASVHARLSGAAQVSVQAHKVLEVYAQGASACRCLGRPLQCHIRESEAASVKFVTEKDVA